MFCNESDLHFIMERKTSANGYRRPAPELHVLTKKSALEPLN